MSVSVAGAHLHNGAAAVGASIGRVLEAGVRYERDDSAAAILVVGGSIDM